MQYRTVVFWVKMRIQNWNEMKLHAILCKDSAVRIHLLCVGYSTFNTVNFHLWTFEKEKISIIASHFHKENKIRRKKAEIPPCVPAHRAATRNRRPPTDSSINFHVGGSTLFRPHTRISTRTHVHSQKHTHAHKSRTWGDLPSHRSVRCSHNLVPIILRKQKV